MLWCIIILISILGPNRREFNERTTYKYVGKIKGTSKEWCDIQGAEQQTWGSCGNPVSRGGRDAISRSWRAKILAIRDKS